MNSPSDFNLQSFSKHQSVEMNFMREHLEYVGDCVEQSDVPFSPQARARCHAGEIF